MFQAHSITHIVNVSTNCEKAPDIPDECFLRIPVNDGYIDNLRPYFTQAHDFISMYRLLSVASDDSLCSYKTH